MTPTLRYYVSTPTGKLCLSRCREYGFREMSCPIKISKGKIMKRSTVTNLEHYTLDNGAWLYYKAGFTMPDFTLFFDVLKSMGKDADFVVVPDVVAAGAYSLQVSQQHLPTILDSTNLALIPVQDGMRPEQIEALVSPRVGLFVGGSFEWKWTTLPAWANFASERGIYIHVGRVNSAKRSNFCADLKVHSADGSTVARFSKTASRMARAVDPDRHVQRQLFGQGQGAL